VSFQNPNPRWTEREANLKGRRDAEMQVIEQEMQERLAMVDEEWDSDEMKALYRRPSPELTALRQHAADDPSVARKEEQERQSADARREEAHANAQALVRAQYQGDLEAIEKNYDRDWKEMQKAKLLEFRKIERNIQNLQAQRDRLEMSDPLTFSPKSRVRSPARTPTKVATLPRLGP
jgi:hypothetical protein